MSGTTISDPESKLAQRERELALVLEVDRIRDEFIDSPQQMLSAVLRAVAESLSADLGLIALVNDQLAFLQKIAFDPRSFLSHLPQESLDRVVDAAMALHTESTLEAGEVLAAAGVRGVLAAPLRVASQQLGSLILCSMDRVFNHADLLQFSVACSQTDSAVLQARTQQELVQRKTEVEEQNHQLDVIYRLDRIRDETQDTNRFLMQVADVLIDALDVDLCMVGLVEDDTNRLVPRSVNDRTGILRSLEQADIDRMFQQVSTLDGPRILEPEPALAEVGVCSILSAPLFVRETLVGAFVLARCSRVFSAVDVELLYAVATQVDSALDHLRTLRDSAEHALQIETIYRIDQVRDEASSEIEMLSAVANIATSTLNADLCLMSLVNEETGKSELKAIEDRQGVFSQLDRDAIERLIQWAGERSGVAAIGQHSPLDRWQLGYVLGAPLVVSGQRLGALVLANGRRPFEAADRELLRAVVSQTDSAVVYARAQRHLELRNRELETLYRVDSIRDQGYEFGVMLSAVLSELCTAIEAEMGFIMLFDDEANQLELKASTADDMLAGAGYYDLIEDAANRALNSGTLYAADNVSDWLHSIICVPLILRDRVIGVFGAVNRKGPGGFSAEDKRLLLAITSQVDTAIFESLDKQRIRNTFQRYVGPNVMEQMLATPERDWLKGERARLSVLFSDMRGFTSMSERVDVDLLVEMINGHLGAMTQVVLDHDGTLDKFVADEVMAIFGAPVSKQDHAIRAIQTALGMQEAQGQLIEEWQRRGYQLPPIGIGINTGEMVVGNIGCSQQMDYTVLGDVVNLASRLCDAAAGNQVLITASTYELARDRIVAEKLPVIRVKGKEDPVQVFQVLDLK